MSDFRAEQSPVFDQGARPTCAACAVTSAHEWMLGGNALSVEDAFHHGKLVDGLPGMHMTGVHDILGSLATPGHAIETSWPYGKPAWPGTPPASSTEAANRRPVPSWERLGRKTFAELRALLGTGAIVLCLCHVASAWNPVSGLVHCAPGTAWAMKHAVVAVGDRRIHGHDCLVVKNSWGPSWGDSGYGYISQSYVDAYLSDAYIVKRPELRT